MVKYRYSLVIIIMILIFLTYYLEGYFLEASILFNVFYICTILVSAYALSKLELLPMFLFTLTAALLGVCVELLNTVDGNWEYFNGGQPPIYVAIGWAFILALVFYASGLIKKYLTWKDYPLIPVGICFILFFIFSYFGGYLSVITILLYLTMAIMGIYGTYKSSSGWTVGVLVMGIIIGTGSELLGAMNGLWSYQYNEIFPIHMVFAWAANAFCLLGLLALFGFNAEKLFSK